MHNPVENKRRTHSSLISLDFDVSMRSHDVLATDKCVRNGVTKLLSNLLATKCWL